MKKNFQTLFVLFTIAAGNAIADTGFSDSPPFYLNLISDVVPCVGFADSQLFALDSRFLKPNGTAVCCNSPPFALNLRGINRVWADSDTFQFDWLANTSPQAGTIVTAAPVAAGSLKELSGGVWIDAVTIPPFDSTVIILSHGWNDDADGMLSLANAIHQRAASAYIYAWNWGKGANTVSLSNPNGEPSDERFCAGV